MICAFFDICVQWLYMYMFAFISLYFYTKQLFVQWTLTECTLSTALIDRPHFPKMTLLQISST